MAPSRANSNWEISFATQASETSGMGQPEEPGFDCLKRRLPLAEGIALHLAELAAEPRWRIPHKNTNLNERQSHSDGEFICVWRWNFSCFLEWFELLRQSRNGDSISRTVNKYSQMPH